MLKDSKPTNKRKSDANKGKVGCRGTQHPLAGKMTALMSICSQSNLAQQDAPANA
ncbi:MAG: hypothetical protein PHC51_00750 [bacterium]|nr:hypothetical protein [bacterium]